MFHTLKARPSTSKDSDRCVAVAWSQSQNPSEVCLQCPPQHLTLTFSLRRFPCGGGGQRPPCHPRSRAGERAGAGATPGLVGSGILPVSSVERCLADAPALAVWPLSGRPLPSPQEVAQRFELQGLLGGWGAAECFAAGCGRVARRISPQPLANCCIIHLGCHQSVSVYH